MADIRSNDFLSILALIACLAPLITFIFGLWAGKGLAKTVAIFSVTVSFLASAVLFAEVWNIQTILMQFPWFSIGIHSFQAGIFLNNLSVLMMLLVSGIALLVHIYSLAYMKDDPRLGHYWSYLGLFCFAMLSLVAADNLLLIYMFWELVGFASYLLIGFWFSKEAAALAAKKAFIINRLGDLGFLCGLFVIYSQFGTFDLNMLFAEGGLVAQAGLNAAMWTGSAGSMPPVWLSLVGVAFFIAAMSKSAQFPFHTWLPDAMEGPTSVSSLIHAATMVAAGVFLLARVYPIFDVHAQLLMVCVGTVTALMAATIALKKYDIKRILAFSTVSQLGFMVAGMGMGAYGDSLLHLVSHAFFKCLLFLGAGAVIHQFHRATPLQDHLTGPETDHQDIRNMGGFRKPMPITFLCMCVAAAALAGLPLTSGFLSKDALLLSSFDWASGKGLIWMVVPICLVLTSLLTVVYISRLLFRVFWGELKWNIKEAPGAMTSVLIILAICSSFLIFTFNPVSVKEIWLLSGFQANHAGTPGFANLLVPIIIPVLSIGLIYLCYQRYVNNPHEQEQQAGFVTNFLQQEWYIDLFIGRGILRPFMRMSIYATYFDRYLFDGAVNGLGGIGRLLARIASWFDKNIVDGMVNGIARASGSLGNLTRKFQTGKLQHYFLTMLAVLIITFIIRYLA